MQWNGRIAIPLLMAALWAAAPSLAVEGEWFTDVAQALETAKKDRKPVLAVAMDHG